MLTVCMVSFLFSFTFNLSVSLYSNPRQIEVMSLFFIHSINYMPLIIVVIPLTFNIIINMFGFSLPLYYQFFLVLLFYTVFLPLSCFLFNYMNLVLHFNLSTGFWLYFFFQVVCQEITKYRPNLGSEILPILSGSQGLLFLVPGQKDKVSIKYTATSAIVTILPFHEGGPSLKQSLHKETKKKKSKYKNNNNRYDTMWSCLQVLTPSKTYILLFNFQISKSCYFEFCPDCFIVINERNGLQEVSRAESECFLQFLIHSINWNT